MTGGAYAILVHRCEGLAAQEITAKGSGKATKLALITEQLCWRKGVRNAAVLSCTLANGGREIIYRTFDTRQLRHALSHGCSCGCAAPTESRF